MKTKSIRWMTGIFCLLVSCSLPPARAEAAVMNDYCSVPPFVAQTVPPLVLLTTGRDHKLYYEAFNEAMDLDEDGRVDIGYMHNIDYYGYFDSYKCYTYSNTSSLFSPASTTADKFCTTGQWSGNVLNWLTMSRMDVLRKVLYGGHRSTDSTTSTILERVYVPGDAHSWGKEIPGKLCGSGSTFKNTCYTSDDCDAGYSCTDKSLNLIGMAAADSSVCAATAVTWSSATNGKILVAQYSAQAGGAANGPTHADLLKSYYTDGGGATIAPLALINMSATGNPSGTSTRVKYIDNFNDASVNPENPQTAGTNILAVTAFTTKDDNNYTGFWQFAVDGNDGVEVEILPANKLPANPANWLVATYYGAHVACFQPSATKNPSNTAYCNATQSSLNNGFFNSTLAAGSKVWSKKTSSGNPVTCTATVDTISSTAADGYCVNGGIKLVKNTKYFMIVRQTNGIGNGGVRVWYRKPLDGPTAWNIFGANTDLTLSSPTIAPGNECSIRYKVFVDKADTTTGENKQHLFCSTTRSVGGTPLLRLLKNRVERKWNWASKERPVCADVIRNTDDTDDIDLTVDTAKSDAAKIWDYTVRNEVCKTVSPDNRPAAKQDPSASGREINCRAYTSGSTTTYKPAGLLQKYGEGDGNKVCSRTYSKSCTADSDCTNTASTTPPVFEGLCIDKAPMYFGLMTDSYVKNLSGGVLRKDIWSLSDEINMATGQFIVPTGSATFASTYPQGAIIPTFESLKTVGFEYTNNAYDDTSTTNGNNGGTCGWIVNNPLPEGNCRMWGNPIGEMMYEGLRYLAGKTAPTAGFIDTAAQDGSLPIYRQDWGVVRGSNTFRPYGNATNQYPIFPSCSKPFMLVLSDENVSYDSDSIPGSKFNTSFAEDAGLPLLNINVGTLTDTIGGPVASGGEGINGTSVVIGETTTLRDFMCSAKTATNLSLIRGLCSEEPTKQGSYYSAGVAYYGKTLFKTNTGRPNVTTYSLVLSSPVPKMVIPVNGKTVTLVPVGKSTSGGGVETSCANRCTITMNALGSLVISGCSTPATPTTAGSFCPSNQIVDFYVDTVLYDNNNAPPYSTSNPAPSITYAKFRINFEDVEQGADHDMDAIATYEICTGSTCSPAIASDKIKVSVSSDYAAGGINQAMGFVISGTSEDATYLVVRDSDSSTDCSNNEGACDLPLDWEHTFSVSTTTTASSQLLHNPLWYAAKWGGFNDSNNNSLPDVIGEWAKNDGVNPDNYYLVVNPLKLETQLDKALTDILSKTSSGTAASIVNKRQESGANLLTAVFYPEREFKSGSTTSKAKWVGDLQNYWFYFDPFFASSGLVEDTTNDGTLNLLNDYKADMAFDSSLNRTVATRYSYDGKIYSFVDSIELDSLKALWHAGDALFARTTARKVYTNITAPDTANNDYSAVFLSNDFATTNKTSLKPYLQAATDDEASTLINYILGTDNPTSGSFTPSYRKRTVTHNGSQGVWKLGDIVSSTPKIQSSIPINSYHQGYGDKTYSLFFNSSNYKNRAMVYAGANDGMLHAFTLGKIEAKTKGSVQATISAASGTTLGGEEWAFIPRNALPYLKYISDPSYDHIYTVDLTPLLVDASIDCGSTTAYENCIRTTTYSDATTKTLDLANTSWRTLLIGGMGLGGASRAADGSCNSTSTINAVVYPDCVKAPINTTGYTKVGLSSYFAIDVTTPSTPTLKWEFSDPGLGLTLVDPAIVRINGTTTVSGKKATDTNGKWFAVFASGPTGPINTSTHQFYGRSDQTMKIYVVDIATGKLAKKFDLAAETSVDADIKAANAFGSSLTTNAIDTTEGNPFSSSYYSTDVVYIGYVRQKKSGSSYTWDGSDGGLLRLLTNDDPNPANWTLSSLIDGTGPVTSSISKMTDISDPVTRKPTLWLYFGAGRYFYKDTAIDSADEVQSLFAIKEPCYITDASGSHIGNACAINQTTQAKTETMTTAAGGGKITLPARNTNGSQVASGSDLFDSTFILSLDNTYYEDTFFRLSTPKLGWFATLDSSAGDFKAERMITTPLIRTSGMAIFTTFKPTADICSFGGKTLENFRHYRTGGLPPAGSLKGKITVQLSTGAIVTTDLSQISTNLGVGDKPPIIDIGMGKPPSQPPQDDKPRKPVKKILHIQEK